MYADVDDNAFVSLQMAMRISNHLIMIKEYINSEVSIDSFEFDSLYSDKFMEWLSNGEGEVDAKKRALEMAVDRMGARIKSYGNHMQYRQISNQTTNETPTRIKEGIETLKNYIQMSVESPDMVIEEADIILESVNAISKKAFLSEKNEKPINQAKNKP